ncbi:unnamed protein product [Phytophthora fragariaefolia]|uniref:Unnamed protein product n=1 Tax=Phytophthora fragariaefolia TaxID=1490495 RepID=A0A9W6TL71_9STRA|nr:unnamed protein product [Phytophthora fragariaefolia]
MHVALPFRRKVTRSKLAFCGRCLQRAEETSPMVVTAFEPMEQGDDLGNDTFGSSLSPLLHLSNRSSQYCNETSLKSKSPSSILRNIDQRLQIGGCGLIAGQIVVNQLCQCTIKQPTAAPKALKCAGTSSDRTTGVILAQIENKRSENGCP